MGDIALAMELLEQGRREDAVRELERVLAADIDQISAWRLLAQAVTHPAEIKECYEHILRLDPHDSEAIEMLHSLGENQPEGDGSPFFPDDLPDLDPTWDAIPEPPTQPGIDTAPLHIPESGIAPPPPDQPHEPADAWTSPEALLFDDEDARPASKREPRGSIFDNDAFFYTAVVIVILAVAVILYFLFGDRLLPLLKGLLPGT